MSNAVVILAPQQAVEEVAHEEQLRIWANDIVGLLSVNDYLRDDLSYDDGVNLEKDVMRELKSILEMAFDHPAARTILRKAQR